MRSSQKKFIFWNNGCVLLLSLALAGCVTDGPTEPQHPPPALRGDVFQVGELITVTWSDMATPLPEYKERIKEDGTISLPYVGSVKAAGKKRADLEKEIHDLYVPKYYLHATITVKPEERYYFVGGEVKIPSRQPYLGETTILRAVASAGGFTDFANRRKVQVTRVGASKPITVDCIKALQEPNRDLPVYPGDTIFVPRRFF